MATIQYWQSLLFWLLIIIAIFVFTFVMVGIGRDYYKRKQKRYIKTYFVYLGITAFIYGMSVLVLNVSAVAKAF